MIGMMDDMRFLTDTRYQDLRAEADARRLAKGSSDDTTEATVSPWEANEAQALDRTRISPISGRRPNGDGADATVQAGCTEDHAAAA